MSHENLFFLILALAAAGGVAGFISGLLGVGGGTVLVPVLYELFTFMDVPEAYRMHLSVGTTFAIMLPTAVQSLRKHMAKNAVDIALLKAWAPGLVGGVLLGWLVANYASGAVLRGVFGGVSILLAFKLFFGRDEWRLGDKMPKRPILDIIGGAIGFISSLMGIGGGMLGSAVMMLYNRPIHNAVATSAGFGLIVSIPGVIGYALIGQENSPALPPFSIGYVNLLAMALIVPLSVLAAPLGVRLAHYLEKRRLEQAFGMFLLLISLRFLYSIL